MKIRSRTQDKVCILECAGELTIGAGETQLRDEFKSLLERGERNFVLDYRGLRFMDSSGLGETIACAKRALERDGAAKILLAEEGAIRRIFHATLLDRAFEFFTDEERALASFRP